METSVYPFLERWWLEDFTRITLNDISKYPAFNKLLSITGEYEYSFKGFNEKFTKSGDFIEIKVFTDDGKNIELARASLDLSSRFYYKLVQMPTHEYEVQTDWNEKCEKGFEVYRYGDVERKNEWEKILDTPTNLEYFKDSDEKCFIYKLDENNGVQKKTKFTTSCYHFYEKKVKKVRKERNIDKWLKKTRYGREVKVISTLNEECLILYQKNMDGLYILKNIKRSPESFEQMKIHDDKSKNVKIESKKIVSKNCVIGEKKYSITNKSDYNFYELCWAIKGEILYTQLHVVADSSFNYSKKVLSTPEEFLEIEDINQGLDRWGCINRNFSGSTFYLEWTGADSQIYDFHIQRCSEIMNKDLPKNSAINQDHFKYLPVIKADAEYIFEVIEKIEKYNFNYFSSLSKILYNYDEGLNSYSHPDTLIEDLKEREFDYEVLSNKNTKRNFRKFLASLLDQEDKHLLLEELHRHEKFLSNILQQAKITKKVLIQNNFSIEGFLKIQGLIFDLSYAIQVINILDEAPVQTVKVDRISFAESSEKCLICVVCNLVCHQKCEIDGNDSDIGSKITENCIKLQQKDHKCEACYLKCSYFYHIRVNKTIKVEQNYFESREFNNTYNAAQELRDKIRSYLIENDLIALTNIKLNLSILIIQGKINLIKSSKSDSSDSSDSSESSEEFDIPEEPENKNLSNSADHISEGIETSIKSTSKLKLTLARSQLEAEMKLAKEIILFINN